MKHRIAVTSMAAALFVGGFLNATQAHANNSRDASLRPVSPSWCADRCDSVVTDWSLTAFQVIKAGDGYADPMPLHARWR